MFEYLLYYPVTFILWVWHKVFGFVFDEANAISWVLGIVFLTFTVRAILFKPFVSQVRSMKKMQDFAPEIKKLQKRYANDKQRQAQAMQKLQREHGVNPLGGCLPILLQVPVFIGLNHTLRAFQFHYDNTSWGNYFFDRTGVKQYIDADLFGSHLGEAIYNTGLTGGTGAGAFHATAIPVAVPLMILASVLTHLTARHSVERQNPASATQQTAMMNKLTLYIFPIGLLVFGAFLPLGLLIYFLSNNAWTLMQQRIVYTRIDREEEAKKAEQVEKRSNLGPKPGQKPSQQKKRPANTEGKSTTAKSGSPKSTSDKSTTGKSATGKSTSAKSTSAKSTAAKNAAAKKQQGDSKAQGPNKAKGQSKSKATGESSTTDKTAETKSSGNSSAESSSKSSSTAPQNGSGGSGSVSGTAKKKADRKRR